MWSGSLTSLPAGYVICNGSNGSPDLRGRFIMGSGGSYPYDSTGGSADASLVSHSHTFDFNGGNGGAHSHNASTKGEGGHLHDIKATQGFLTIAGTSLPAAANGPTPANISTDSEGQHSHALTIDGVGDHTHTYSGTSGGVTGGVGATNRNLPPYFALAFLLKTNDVGVEVPTGSIIFWSGDVGTTPDNYRLCDGTNGTPDLRARFIIGQNGGAYPHLSTGGYADAALVSHTHTFSGTTEPSGAHSHTATTTGAGGHAHEVSATQGTFFGGVVMPQSGNGNTATDFGTETAGEHKHDVTIDPVVNHTHSFSGTSSGVSGGVSGVNPAGRNLPPYYVLVLLMKT